jgi:hypothetical protein
MHSPWRALLRVAAAFFVLTTGYIWTVGQTGVSETNKHLCELGRQFVAGLSDTCEIHQAFAWAWGVLFLAACGYLLYFAAHFVAKRVATARPVTSGAPPAAPLSPSEPAVPPTEASGGQDVMTINDVFRHMERSGWGRRAKAEAVRRGNSTIHTQEYIDELCRVARTGEVAVRGRVNDKGFHQPIPPEVWLSSSLDFDVAARRQDSRTAPIHHASLIPIYTELRVSQPDVINTWPMNEEDGESHAGPHGRTGSIKERLLKTLESRAAVVEAGETHLATVKPDEDDFGLLFEERATSPEKTELRLRFLPDGDNIGMKAVLVICLLYKRLRRQNRVSCNFVANEVEYLFEHAPNTPRSYIERLGYGTVVDLRNKRSHADTAIAHGYLSPRQNLARGGAYELTAKGENFAMSVARDMVSRA